MHAGTLRTRQGHLVPLPYNFCSVGLGESAGQRPSPLASGNCPISLRDQEGILPNIHHTDHWPSKKVQ